MKIIEKVITSVLVVVLLAWMGFGCCSDKGCSESCIKTCCKASAPDCCNTPLGL